MRQAGRALSKSEADIAKYANRSMNFVNMWDPSVTHDGFTGFAQRRYPVGCVCNSSYKTLTRGLSQNGTFAFSSPDACSPVDPVGHSCARGSDNNVGFYECKSLDVVPQMLADRFLAASSWEYSFYAPQSVATLIDLMGGNATFTDRVYASSLFQICY